jgi:hypothetical protein
MRFLSFISLLLSLDPFIKMVAISILISIRLLLYRQILDFFEVLNFYKLLRARGALPAVGHLVRPGYHVNGVSHEREWMPTKDQGAQLLGLRG